MEFVILKSFNNYVDAHIMLGRMKEEGIHCWLKNENTTTIMPIWTTALGGIQLMVNSAQQKKAAYILDSIEEERKEHMSCPKCNSRDVEFINTMRKPVNWLSAATSFLLGDYAMMPEQRYHCFHCGEEWEDNEP
jgi:DNA-directed RNA polymerase subunit RPC12/RpoP